MDDELQRYHLSSCKKYEILRGIYPNNKRLTGESCSCELETVIAQEQAKAAREALLINRSDIATIAARRTFESAHRYATKRLQEIDQRLQSQESEGRNE